MSALWKLSFMAILKTIISFATLEIIGKCEPREGYVDFISVDPDCRGLGIGQNLLEKADEIESGCHVCINSF